MRVGTRKRAARCGLYLIAILFTLAACGGHAKAATPSRFGDSQNLWEISHNGLENRVKTPTTTPEIGISATPNPPPCDMECAPPTDTPTPPPTATPVTPTPTPLAAPTDAPVEAQSVGGDYAGQCGGGYFDTVTQWWAVITQYPWDACTVLAIIQRESHGLNVYNYEGSGACGVLQLLPCEYPDDGAANIAAGFAKWEVAGWSPWGG